MVDSSSNLMAEYRSAMKRRSLADGTIKKRLRVARKWLAWMGEEWPNARWPDIDSYGDTREIAPGTWSKEIGDISAFYRWAMRRDLALNDPTILVERPPRGDHLPRPASEHQYRRLVDEATPMLRAIIDLAAWCGLRCCEISRLRWIDVDLVERALTVVGKGNKERMVGMPQAAVRALAAIDDGERSRVILGPRGTPVRPARVSSMVANHARAVGVPVTAHQLRHRYASLLYDETNDIYQVQKALGHASPDTTQVYTKIDKRKAMASARQLDKYDVQRPTLF